ncbi:hypothetical protein ACF1GT_18315 [Streptomyces sp. NPDC014636]|uniref:ATP-dependent DNA ligase n=1 Tax=Streptomyces sp. NPDC014636 TaxID=3364876 RepID=UPI0036FF33D7
MDRVPIGDGLIYQAKLDGWRCVLDCVSGRVWSRHGKDLTRAFADLSADARRVPACVLDCEVVAALHTGEVSFTRPQSRAGRGPRPGEDFDVHAVVLDLLAVGEVDWRGRRYHERRARWWSCWTAGLRGSGRCRRPRT